MRVAEQEDDLICTQLICVLTTNLYACNETN